MRKSVTGHEAAHWNSRSKTHL